MRPNDDDIKIFHPRKAESSGEELAELVSVTEKHRKNGNTEKAIKLGEALADLTPESFCPDKSVRLKNNELFQLRSLMLFASQIFLHKYLPHPVLSTQAVNAMYNRLEQTSEGVFANISDGSSFTFYYLSVRKDSGAAESIGKNFAMLCDRDNDEQLTALGESVYSQTEAAVCKLIEEFRFEN